MTDTVLFDYWRSSASYRVRIALNMLAIPIARFLSIFWPGSTNRRSTSPAIRRVWSRPCRSTDTC
jgi:glutathione S-transferase